MKNKKNSNIYKEDSSTSLVWIIWIFIILVAFIGNNQALQSNYLKSSINEGISANVNYSELNDLREWKQILNIGWKEYIITVIANK
ncbi:MAG: hypothetical protein ACD_3C00082G0013 [uncultured bacterium (gcode 4)]|uniref:Uncharacterized protein n=1 Tax=uncultured bacterium (gcode 4) TaxID=1234023 RepID=K2FAZ9_9BACT|nr:MAG: hypothetical protein ACD_3C00082G0013 [uncultured bacterium (gcode 4)]